MIKFIARQYLRFNMGGMVLSILNLAIVAVAASDKITTITNLPAKVIVPCIVVLSVVLVWLIGLLMDKAKFLEAYQAEQNKRNEMLSTISKK